MKPICTIVLLFIISTAFAQQQNGSAEKQNSISIVAGYNQFKDENLHPKVHSGLLISTSFQHSEISKIISEYGAGLKVSIINTAFEEFASSANIQILGNYKYLFTIAEGDKLIYSLGPVFDLQYGASAYFNWDESHLYWANYLCGGIGNRFSYKLKGKTLNITFDIPVVSIISRPENNRQYKIDDLTFKGIVKNLCSNLEGALPDRNFYLKAGFELKTPLQNKKIRSFGYNFKYHYMQATNAMPFQNIEHSIFYKFFF
jgi:hypothetical protein